MQIQGTDAMLHGWYNSQVNRLDTFHCSQL